MNGRLWASGANPITGNGKPANVSDFAPAIQGLQPVLNLKVKSRRLIF